MILALPLIQVEQIIEDGYQQAMEQLAKLFSAPPSE
jgi:hypothetical protein